MRRSERSKKWFQEQCCVKEKTVQEIQEEQTAMIKQLSEQIAKLQAEVRNGQSSTESDKADA